MDNVKCCEISTGIGALVGGLTGLGLGIWTHLQFVKPTFDDINAMNNSQDTNLTVAIVFLGVLEVIGFTCAGALLGAGASALGAKIVGCNTPAIKETTNQSSFFNSGEKKHTSFSGLKAHYDKDKNTQEECKNSEVSQASIV